MQVVMSRNKKKIYASLGVLSIAAAGLFTADKVTDRPSSDDADAVSAGPADSQRGTQTYAGNIGVGSSNYAAAAERLEGTFSGTQVIVSAADGASLTTIAARYGVEVIKDAGRSGYGAIGVPAGQNAGDFVASLERDGQVGQAMPDGLISGAGKSKPCDVFKAKKAARAMDYQWHLDSMDAAEAGAIDASGVVVAVLDTGIAYEDWSDASGDYVLAPSLASSTIYSPWDFVNDDAHANDDHQHGTHIASAIASHGEVEGVAPGASLMPLKVLDSQNAGTEIDLIEAIHHAVDHGADIINMSLSFGLGYTPSAAMLDAFERAEDAGVVMVAASGNSGADQISYPAASPLVIAVGAVDASGTDSASYSNLSNRVDVMAPGGDISADLNDDGLPDGIIAETIKPTDPTETGLWMYAGTSQAAALVSGTIANMIAEGALPEEISPALEYAAWKKTSKKGKKKGDEGWFEEGRGSGPVNAEEAGKLTCKGETNKFMPRDLGAAVLPYLVDNGDGSLTPTARITVVDFDGGKLKHEDVYVTVSGTQNALLSCDLDKEGICTVEGDDFVPGADGELFAFEVTALVDDGVIARPTAVAFATDALEVITTAIQADASLDGSLLGFSWEAVSDPDLGDLAPGTTVVNLGTGLASSPLGFVVTPRALGTPDTSASLDMDGTGLASSPLGFLSINKYSFGSGLASSPLGFLSFNLVTVSGTGLASSPLGFHSLGMLSTGVLNGTINGSGLASSPLGFSSEPIKLSTRSLMGGSGAGSAIELQLDMGGWTAGAQTERVTTTLAGSGAASMATTFSFSSYGGAAVVVD
jgi:hypothetical protein